MFYNEFGMNLTSTLLLGVFCIGSFFSFGQNLFQNPGFEQYYACPNSYNQMGQVQHWQSGNQATPDYFNCGFSGSLVQGTASQGSGVVGLWGGPNHPNCTGGGYAENVVSTLSQAIVPGKQYLLSFDIQIDTGTPNDCMMMGFYFFNTQSAPSLTGTCAPSVQPQVSIACSSISNSAYTHVDFFFSPDQIFDQVLISPFTTSHTSDPACSSYSTNRMYLNLDNLSLTEEIVLAVDIEHFTVSQQQSDILLEWFIHHTGELDYLEVQKRIGHPQSEDRFESIGFLPAQQCDETVYSFLDQDVQGSLSSYRIKAVDHHGAMYYSSIATLDSRMSKAAYSVHPNPSNDVFWIQSQLESQEQISWTIWGKNGQQLLSDRQTFKRGLVNIPVDLQSLPKGLYALVIKNGKGEEYVKHLMLK